MEGDLTWGSEHTIQYTDDVLNNCTLETYVILLSNVTPINSIKKGKSKSGCCPKKFMGTTYRILCAMPKQVPSALATLVLISPCSLCDFCIEELPFAPHGGLSENG